MGYNVMDAPAWFGMIVIACLVYCWWEWKKEEWEWKKKRKKERRDDNF